MERFVCSVLGSDGLFSTIASISSFESLISIVENLAVTVDNLNRTTTRINTLLDDIEEPMRRVMPQVGNAMNAMATMGEAATQLTELSKRLGPLTTLAENAGGLFGFKTSRPTPPTESPES
jgi:methyl-accepting chemotaxis protein